MLEISTGATANTQGQFAYALSGIDPNEVYDVAGKMMAKMQQYPGFLFVDLRISYNHTPNLQVDILRDQAKTLWRLGDAHSVAAAQRLFAELQLSDQEADDQYQVILEVADDQDRSSPEDLSMLYIKSDDGQRMVPLSAVTNWHPVDWPAGGEPHQPVHQRDHLLQPETRLRHRPATDFVEQTAKELLPPGIRGSLQGEALTFRNTVSRPGDPDGRSRVRHVRDPGDSLRELSAPDHGAFLAAGRAARRAC